MSLKALGYTDIGVEIGHVDFTKGLDETKKQALLKGDYLAYGGIPERGKRNIAGGHADLETIFDSLEQKGVSENVQGFVNFNCIPKSEYKMLCENSTLDTRTGKISNGHQLQKLIITKNGNKIREYDYKNKSGKVSMIIQLNGNEKSFIGVEPELANSTFTKLFLLNQPDNNYFTLKEDGWPYYRIFKLNL